MCCCEQEMLLEKADQSKIRGSAWPLELGLHVLSWLLAGGQALLKIETPPLDLETDLAPQLRRACEMIISLSI